MLLAQNNQKTVGAAQPPTSPGEGPGENFLAEPVSEQTLTSREGKGKVEFSKQGPGFHSRDSRWQVQGPLSVCQVANTGLPVWNCWVSTAACQLEAWLALSYIVVPRSLTRTVRTNGDERYQLGVKSELVGDICLAWYGSAWEAEAG